MWNSQERGWDDSGWWDAAAWMARRREALLFQNMVYCHTPREHRGMKPRRWTVPSALHETPALAFPFSWNSWRKWHRPWSFQCQLLSWAISPDPLCRNQESSENSHVPLIYGSAITFPFLSQCWLLHGYFQLERTFPYFTSACHCRSRKCKLQLQSKMSHNVVEMGPTLPFSLLLAFQFQHRIWLVKVDFPKTFVNDLCPFLSINFKGLREVWTITLNILTCSFESISGHAH